jgi:hypothetical protein
MNANEDGPEVDWRSLASALTLEQIFTAKNTKSTKRSFSGSEFFAFFAVINFGCGFAALCQQQRSRNPVAHGH